MESLNPLFIRSQIQSLGKSIRMERIIKSQSLIHQVSDSEFSLSFKEEEEREEMSQSLIHQVSDSEIKIFTGIFLKKPEAYVSIPYSSGLRFRVYGLRYKDKHFKKICLNPLFIRSQIQRAPYFQPINTDS